ncbi:MAG: SRPBCC family protein [Bdellovibrionales bacterium]|nr:SRPBCC family protein [Bdellovibrionales bacterium]
MASAETKELFDCTPEQFYDVVSDYESYPKFLDEVQACRVVERDGNRALVEFKVKVVKEFTYRMWITEDKPKGISWVFESGDIFKVSNGSWKLEDHQGKCQAHYAVEAKFKVFVPGPIAKALVNNNLPNMMKSYQSRIREVYS